jgi:hypothetical protein
MGRGVVDDWLVDPLCQVAPCVDCTDMLSTHITAMVSPRGEMSVEWVGPDDTAAVHREVWVPKPHQCGCSRLPGSSPLPHGSAMIAQQLARHISR